jgi:nicotinamidase/pyrazinamidase
MNTVFVDVDTQLDFVCPAGALYASGAERIWSNLARLTRHAASQGIKIVSTTDAHAEDDAEFRVWKPHCVWGTAGQQKLAATLREHRYVLSRVEDRLDRQAAHAAQQVIVEKQDVDCFTNPNLIPLIETLGSTRFVTYGVFTEICVLYAVRGFLRLGHSVEIVSDAIWALSEEGGRKALDELAAGGAKLTLTEQLIG